MGGWRTLVEGVSNVKTVLMSAISLSLSLCQKHNNKRRKRERERGGGNGGGDKVWRVQCRQSRG